MTGLINTLKRKTSLRQEMKNASNADIERMIKNLNDLLIEREEAEARKKADLAEKLEAIKKIQSAMADAGIEIGDLQNMEMPSVKAKTKAAAKYAINVDGKRYEWTGRGRTPTVFADYMKAHSLSKKDLPAA